MYLWWTLCTLNLHACQLGETYRWRLRSLLLSLCYVFRALISSLVFYSYSDVHFSFYLPPVCRVTTKEYEPTHTTPARCWSSASLSVTGSPSKVWPTPGFRKSSVTPNGSAPYCWWAHRSTWGPPPPLPHAPPRTRCRRRKAATWPRSSGLTATSNAQRGVRKVSSRSSSTSSSPLSSTARRRAGSSASCSRRRWLCPGRRCGPCQPWFPLKRQQLDSRTICFLFVAYTSVRMTLSEWHWDYVHLLVH